MQDLPKILLLTTQTWLQVTRLAMRLVRQGCRLSVICPEESTLHHVPDLGGCFRFRLLDPISSLRHAIEASGADYLLPCDDLSVWFLHELADRTPALRLLIERSLGDAHSFPLLRSRMQLLTLAQELGIRVPVTELIRSESHDKLQNESQLDTWCDRPGGFVLKRDGTWGGSGVHIVQGASTQTRLAHARAAYRQLLSRATGGARLAQWLRNGDGSAFARLRCLDQPEITAQAMVVGFPATSMYACHQGRILGEVQARVLVSRGKTGPSMVIQTIRDTRISRAGALLAGRLGVSGFFGLDFMLDDRSGEPFLIELNPRATQLTPLAVEGRVDLASLMWAHWSGKQIPAPLRTGLDRVVCFYPEGQQWIAQTGNYPECQTDLSLGEQAAMNAVVQSSREQKLNLRSLLWRCLSSSKSSLGVRTVPEPFCHEAWGVGKDLDTAKTGALHDAAYVSMVR